MMPDQEFWAHVAAAKWSMDRDSDDAKAVLIARLKTEKKIAEFRVAFTRLHTVLYDTVRRRWGSCGGGLGDDGFDDLLSHIIGLGRAEYERVMECPSAAIKRGMAKQYRESFRYAIPFEDDLKPAAAPKPKPMALVKVLIESEVSFDYEELAEMTPEERWEACSGTMSVAFYGRAPETTARSCVYLRATGPGAKGLGRLEIKKGRRSAT